MDGKSKYFGISFIILILIIILFSSLMISPYKQVDANHIINPDAGVKVQLDGEYLGITTWGDEDVLYYMQPTNYDIIKVDGGYIFLTDDYTNHDLHGTNVSRVHLEGEFVDGQLTQQPFNDEIISGYFFNADNIIKK